MLENDLIEAIIALPTDLFYNTGIATYIWVLSKNKRAERKGKIQLIDASTFYKNCVKPWVIRKTKFLPKTAVPLPNCMRISQRTNIAKSIGTRSLFTGNIR